MEGITKQTPAESEKHSKTAVDTTSSTDMKVELSREVMDLLLKTPAGDQSRVSIDDIQNLAKAREDVSDLDLNKLVIENPGSSQAKRKAAAIVYMDAASDTYDSTKILNRMTAAILSDAKLSQELMDKHVQSKDEQLWQAAGELSGLISATASYLGIKSILGAAKNLPLPAIARPFVAVGSALLAGGAVDNKVRGDGLLSSTGYLNTARNGAFAYGAGLLFGYPGTVALATSSIGGMRAIDTYTTFSHLQSYKGNFAMASEKSNVIINTYKSMNSGNTAEEKGSSGLKYTPGVTDLELSKHPYSKSTFGKRIFLEQ